MPGGSELLPKELRARLGTRLFGRRVYYLPEVDSTNRLAADLARAGETHGTLVVADHQTRGRGRRDRRWESPRGRNLLFSLILRPEGTARDVLPLSLALSLGISRALSGLLSVRTGVKWPNDVEAEGRKIAGTLAESATRGERPTQVVVGTGVNVNERAGEFGDEFQDRACSCYTITGREWDRGEVLAAILLEMESAYGEFDMGGFAPIAERYKASLGILGKRIRFERRGGSETGTVAGVAPDGALIVDTAAGRIVLYEEEVVRIREEDK